MKFLLMTGALLAGSESVTASGSGASHQTVSASSLEAIERLDASALDETGTAPVKLDRLVVTGTRTERPIGDTPVRTELVLRSTIVRFGARNLGPMFVLNNRVGAFLRTPSFVVFDLSVGRHVAWLGMAGELRLGVRNLTDDRQKDFDTGATRDSDYVYGPRAPRTFFAGLTCKF